MSFLKTFSKRADEPFRPDPVVEDEVVEEVTAPPTAPVVDADKPSKPFDLSDISEKPAKPIEIPDVKIELKTADLATNLEALNSRKLATSAAQQGALEPVAALREAARLKTKGANVDSVDRSQVFDYMRGREVEDTYTTAEGQVRPVTEIFTQSVVDLPEAQMKQLAEEGRQVKKIRTFEDISVDVLSRALKDEYVKKAGGDKAAGSAKYKADLQSLADSGVLPARADGQPLTLRDVESVLTSEYGRRMAGPKAGPGVNLLLSVTEDAGNESLNLVESNLRRRAAAATGFGAGLLAAIPSTFDEEVDTTRTFEPIEGIGDFIAGIVSVAAPDQLLEDSSGRALRLESEVADNIPQNVILDAIKRNRLGQDPDFSDFKSVEDPAVKAIAQLPAEEQNLKALADRIGIRADVLAGTSQAESGNNPTELAFNLDEAREFMTPEQVAELDRRLNRNLGYVRPADGTDEPIFGREKVNQYINEVAAVSPQAAVRATAFGQFQVLGETGKFLDLAREEYAKQFPDEPALDDDQAAVVALEMFKNQPRAVSFALAERWWAQRPTLKEKVNAGDFSTLTESYTGTSNNPEWNERFTRGANRMTALVGQMVPDEKPLEALVSTGPTLFKSGVELDRSLEAQREQQVREEEEAGGFIGVNNRLLASALGSPETEEEFERETGIKATKVEGETFDIEALVNKDFMPNAGTARYEVSVRTWEAILKNSPEEAKRLQNIGMTALGQSFDKVRREVEQRYQSALEKGGFEGMSSEEINRRISLESLDIITSMQVAGVWHTPVYASFDQLMGKTDPEGYFDALAPRIEVLGRSGDEIIYRSETGAMQIFSAIDSLPILGQSYNIGVLENYLFPLVGDRFDQVKSLYDDPSWQNLAALGKTSAKQILSQTVPGLVYHLFSGELKEIHEAGVRGVASRSNFAEFTMDLTADIASYAVETDIGKEAIEATVGREDVVKTQDQIRLAGRFAGLPSGLFLAVVHPDALFGTVSAVKGAKAASRTLLALPDLEKGLSPAIIGGTNLRKLIPTEGLNGRQILHASGDQRKAMTVALAEDFEQLSILADNPENINVDNIKALFARIEGMESVLGDLDKADANRRAASPMLMDELDRITDELLSAARESGDASAAVLVDIPRAKRIGAIVDQVIASGLKNPATKEKAEELSKLVRRGEPGQALADVLTLERSAARRAVKGDVIASEVFSTGDRLKALRLTVELFDDIGANNFNIRRSVFARNIADVSRLENFEVESLNIKLPEGVSEVTPLSAIEVFGAVTENALRTDPKFIAIEDSARKAKILESRQQLEDFVVRIKKAATSAKYEESLLNPDVVDALRLDLINSKLTDVPIDKGGSYISMIYRNHADGGRSATRFNAAVNGLTDQAGVVSGSSTLQQDLYFGMAGILSYNLYRGEATAETARRLVDERALGVAADASPDDVLAAKEAFLQKSPAVTRGTRLVNATLAGTREGLLNLIGATPFMGKDLLRLANVSEENILRLTGTGSKAAMRARSSQMTMDGSDPYAVSAAVQSEVVKRLEARKEAILQGVEDVDEAPIVIRDIDAEIARVNTDEWRVGLVNWMRESTKRKNAGEELPPDFDLPVGIDLKAFTSGTLKYKPSAATKNFVETSGFLKAYGFAGEQTQNNLRLGKLRRTRPKKLSKKEEDAVITILDQMVRFMAKVNFDDSAEVVNAKMANWYEAHIKGVRRTVNNATYQKRLKSLQADFYSTLNAQVESLLGKSLGDFIAEKVADPANLKVPDAFDPAAGAANDLKRGGIAARFDNEGVRIDDVVYEIYDIAEDGTISLRPFGDTDVEKLLDDVDPQTTRVLTGDARQQLDDAILRAQTVALDSLLPVMSDEEAFEIFGAGVDAIRQQIELRKAGVDLTMRTARFLDQDQAFKSTIDPEFLGGLPFVARGAPVTEDGRGVYALLHGTQRVFREFDLKKVGTATDEGYLGDGIYFTVDPQSASAYAGVIDLGDDTADIIDTVTGVPNIMPVLVRAENPLLVNKGDLRGIEVIRETRRLLGLDPDIPRQQLMSKQAAAEVSQAIRSQGHDSVIVYGKGGQIVEVASFDPSKIKSQFDPSLYKNPERARALFQQDEVADVVDPEQAKRARQAIDKAQSDFSKQAKAPELAPDTEDAVLAKVSKTDKSYEELSEIYETKTTKQLVNEVGKRGLKPSLEFTGRPVDLTDEAFERTRLIDALVSDDLTPKDVKVQQIRAAAIANLDYDAMKVKDLKAEIRKRNADLKKVDKLKLTAPRSVLIEQLRKNDNAAAVARGDVPAGEQFVEAKFVGKPKFKQGLRPAPIVVNTRREVRVADPLMNESVSQFEPVSVDIFKRVPEDTRTAVSEIKIPTETLKKNYIKWRQLSKGESLESAQAVLDRIVGTKNPRAALIEAMDEERVGSADRSLLVVQGIEGELKSVDQQLASAKAAAKKDDALISRLSAQKKSLESQKQLLKTSEFKTNFFFTHSLDDTLKFDSPEAALADANRRLSVPDERAATFDEVLPSLSESDLAFVKRALDAAEENENFINIKSINQVAEDVPQKRVSDLYEMMKRTGLFSKRSAKPGFRQVSPDVAAKVNARIAAFFDPKARTERLEKSINLFERINELDLDMLTRPEKVSAILDEDIRDFLLELKKSEPEAYRRMIDLRRDTLSREIAEYEDQIREVERSLDRMKRKVPTGKKRRDIRLAAIRRGEKMLAEMRVNLDTIRASLPTTPPRAEIDMARVEAIADVRRARDAAGIDGAPPPPPTKRGAVEPTPDSPSAGMPKGMVYFFNDTSAILYAFRQADISTGLHEMAHVLRRQLNEDQLRAVTRWTNSLLEKDDLPPIKLTDKSGRLDFDFPDNPESVVMAEELFARAFERYVREGETPNTLLRSAFATMKETLKRIYSAITGNQIDVYISPEMYGLFDDIFGAQRRISLSDISDGPQMYLDMQEVLARGGQRRLTARIAEQEQVEDTFVESRRQLFASLADYRARGFLPLGLKTRGRATAGTVGSKTVDKRFQLGPISRRMLSLEEIGKARETGEVPTAYRALDVAAVTSASIAELGSYLVFLGGDANALLRLVPPAVRTAVNGVVREYEEFSSELSMRLIDVSRMNSEQLKTGVKNLIEYSKGKQVRMLTGAQRGQRARANFVDTEYHFANMIRSFYSKLSSVSKEAAAQDASRVLSGQAQKYGAINGFWRGYSVRTTPKSLEGLSSDEFNDGLRLSSELDELLKETVQKKDTTLSQMQNEMLGNVFSAITGEATVTSNRIEAEKLGAELAFLSGAVPITLKNTDGEDVVFTVADLNPEKSFFENMFFGTTIKKDGAQLTINGITGITEKAPGRAIGTLSIAMQAGYVAGSYDDLRRIGFGLRASDARLFAKYLSGNGAMMSMDELARAKEIFIRFGRTKFEVAPTSLGDFYVPQATREGIVTQQKQALRQMGLQKDLGGISWSPISWMLSFYQSMIIFGSVFQRQAFKLMSTQDLALQVGLVVGGSEGAAAAARASALTLLSAVGAERIAEVAELTVDAAYKIAGKKMPPAMFKSKVREFAIRKGDELVRNVSEFMGAAKFRVEVNPIIENQDTLYVIGGRIYNARDLRKTFTQAGMYSNAFKEMRHDWWRGLPDESAETAEMSAPNKSLLDSTKSATSDFFKTRGRGAQSATRRAFSTVFEHGLESADAWSDLERTGAAVTLMEFGYNPRDAARLVVESVYDYRGSLTEGDRNMVRRLLMPFWAFRKNSNTQALNMMASPQGAFRIMALRRALEFGPEALTHVIYESLLQPYDVDISLMTPRVRDVYYETRTIMELGYGDEADEKTLAEYRAQLPEGSENISDEELLDYSFGGWTIRNGFGGYQNVPGSFRVAFRAILSGNTSSMVRERTGLFRLSDAIAQQEISDFYVQEGAKMAARAARGETGLPAWAAKRPTIQVPLPVLNESAREMLSFMRNTGMTKNETPDPGDSLYFIMPDNFIMSAVDHAGGLLATMAVLYDMGKKTVGVPFVEGEEPPEVGKQDIRRLLNAVEPIVDIRDSGGPQLQLIKDLLETSDLGELAPRRKLHPIMARLIEGSMNISLPHDGDKPLNIPGSAFFFRTAGAFGGEVFAEESLPGRFSRMRSRPVNVVARDAQGRTSADEGFDLSTAKREVDIAQPLITQFDYTVPGTAPLGEEGKERLAYTPYLYGPSAVMFPATFAGQVNKWLLDNVGDSPLEVSMLQDGDFSNFVLNLLAEGYKVVGGRVQVADYGQTASMERQRK